MPREVRPVGADQIELRDRLFAAGLLIPSGIDGVYGHSETFERLRGGLTALVSDRAAEHDALPLSFPPLLPTKQLAAAGYLANMPHLAGTIFSFDGTDAEAQTQAERAAAGEDWSEFQSQTEVSLMPAACYPVYPAIAARGRLPEGGVLVDV
ncbi:MAG: hypothetical protein J2O48_04630, partial [Solirubrobacterales bacterium]|nr:hypothetical protein [Solirubrobacterales bacterium]